MARSIHTRRRLGEAVQVMHEGAWFLGSQAAAVAGAENAASADSADRQNIISGEDGVE